MTRLGLECNINNCSLNVTSLLYSSYTKFDPNCLHSELLPIQFEGSNWNVGNWNKLDLYFSGFIGSWEDWLLQFDSATKELWTYNSLVQLN